MLKFAPRLVVRYQQISRDNDYDSKEAAWWLENQKKAKRESDNNQGRQHNLLSVSIMPKIQYFF